MHHVPKRKKPPGFTSKDSDEQVLEAVFKAYNGALESFTSAANKRIDDTVANYIKEIIELRNELVQMKATHASDLCELLASLECTQSSLEDIKNGTQLC